MTTTFQWNEDAFRQIAEEAVENAAAGQTRDLERLRQQLAGKDVDSIKPALQNLFASYGGRITDPKLTEWAQLISDNTRIQVKPGQIDWTQA